MFAESHTVAFEGIEATSINVQVLVANGLPSFNLVGMPNKVISESKERIRSALKYIGYPLPNKRITVNLSPVDILKEGNHYDLPIAVAILKATQIIKNPINDYIFMGEISLNGDILATNGLIPASSYAKKLNIGIICSVQNNEEIIFTQNNKAITVPNLEELINVLNNENKKYLDINNHSAYNIKNDCNINIQSSIPLEDIKGNRLAKRALMISASGNHHMLMYGPPGTGKSMLAKSILSIMPKLTEQEICEINMIRSIIYGNTAKKYITCSSPFREPHTSSSKIALLGGCKHSQIGEITLAHNGILFLDELAEFPISLLDGLRQPLETKRILVSRADRKICYPANFLLISAMNPCKCGYFYSSKNRCKKYPTCGEEYTRKISGPLLDRIDIKIRTSSIDIFAKEDESDVSSDEIKEKVKKARDIQKSRFKNFDNINYNADISASAINDVIVIDKKSQDFMEKIYKKYELSVRQYHKILKLARTIADVEESNNVTQNHLKEAFIFSDKS
ncbi:YifB family Mg chelatase-like AAA ATPase [Anaplasmataceae bacterium AB001_6]|nr:YifB family Mg chelatase-like AAA ATPase [Anaplasmataceae bacterium AB001_6]